jgi:hypothetical protein
MAASRRSCPAPTASRSEDDPPSATNAFFSLNATYPARPSVHDCWCRPDSDCSAQTPYTGSCSAREGFGALPSL